MSFDNHYPHRKDHRKQYRDSRRFDRTCRNHGSCPYCERNRTHRNRRREPIAMIEDAYEEMEFERAYSELSYMIGEDSAEWPSKFEWLRRYWRRNGNLR